MTTNPAAENARESARKGDGKFGTQRRPDAPDGLIPSPTVAEPETENLDTDLVAAEKELRDGVNPTSLRFALDDLRETTRNHLDELDRTGSYIDGTIEQPSRHTRLQAALDTADTHPDDDDNRRHEALTALVNAVREYRDIPAGRPAADAGNHPPLVERERVQLPVEYVNDPSFAPNATGKVLTEPYDQDGIPTVSVAFPWRDTVTFMRLPAASLRTAPPEQAPTDR